MLVAKAKAAGIRAQAAQAKSDNYAQVLVQHPAKATPKNMAKAGAIVATAAKAAATAAKAAAKAAAAVPPHAGPPPPHAGPPPPKANGGSRPRRAKLKINNSNLLMPFHDITDDPYFIRV